MANEKPHVLFVEDDDDHAELVLRGLDDHGLAGAVHRVADGEAALDYLFRRGAYADPLTSPRPHVVLLDLRLPRVDGIEVLEQIKGSEELCRIPVVVLTTSAAETDVTRARRAHANAYVVKPLDWDRFVELMRDLGLFWPAWNTIAAT